MRGEAFPVWEMVNRYTRSKAARAQMCCVFVPCRVASLLLLRFPVRLRILQVFSICNFNVGMCRFYGREEEHFQSKADMEIVCLWIEAYFLVV